MNTRMPEEIIGSSPVITRFRQKLPTLAGDITPLILIGEPGVGKAFLAAHVHIAGRKSTEPVESLNFSILPERDQRIGLLGAEPPELTSSRRSILEAASAVTLKHIDHANPYLQDILADALATLSITRSGSSRARPVTARVILTLRKTIAQLEKERRLTPKLAHVLRPMKKLHVPPLRKRNEDIPLLAGYYALKLYREFHVPEGISLPGIDRGGVIDAAFLDLLRCRRWNDNVRDLRAFVCRLALLPYGADLVDQELFELLRMVMAIDAREEFSLPSGLAGIERRLVERAVNHLEHNRPKIARLLGLSERTLRRKMHYPGRRGPLRNSIRRI